MLPCGLDLHVVAQTEPRRSFDVCRVTRCCVVQKAKGHHPGCSAGTGLCLGCEPGHELRERQPRGRVLRIPRREMESELTDLRAAER